MLFSLNSLTIYSRLSSVLSFFVFDDSNGVSYYWSIPVPQGSKTENTPCRY